MKNPIDFSASPVPLHVAVISSSSYSPPWNEGVRNLTRRLVQDFSQRNTKVTIVTPKANAKQPFDEPSARLVEVTGLPEWQGRHTWFTAFSHLFLLLRTSWVVRRLKPEPDVLLILASVTSVTGLRTKIYKWASRKPVVLYVTGLSRPRQGYNLGLKADKVLVGSDFLKGWFPGAEVIYPFLPLNVKPAGDYTREESVPFNVAFLGSFEPGRGVEFLLQAMARVKEKTEKPVHLTIGWNGICTENYPNINELIDKLGIRSIVTIHGQVDTTHFYRQADVLVIPRLSQEYMSFPVRIVEAMAMQTPLIVTRVCGMENLIDGCGLSVAPGDVKGLAGAILELLDNPEMRTEFRQNCSIAIKRFGSQTSLDRLYEILRSLARHD